MYHTVYYSFLCVAKYDELWTVNRQLFEIIQELETACAQHQIQLNDSLTDAF
jgi:hypothetical protein